MVNTTDLCKKFGFLEGIYIENSGFFEGILPQMGILKIPRARRVARGIFKIPDGLRGSGQNPRKQNPNFVYIFVVLIILLKQNCYKTLPTLTSQHQISNFTNNIANSLNCLSVTIFEHQTSTLFFYSGIQLNNIDKSFTFRLLILHKLMEKLITLLVSEINIGMLNLNNCSDIFRYSINYGHFHFLTPRFKDNLNRERGILIILLLGDFTSEIPYIGDFTSQIP